MTKLHGLFICLLLLAGSVHAVDSRDGRRDAQIFYTDPNDADYLNNVDSSAARYGLGVSGDAGGINRVKAVNPAYLWFIYNSFEDNYVTDVTWDSEHLWVSGALADSSLDPELMYLHFWDSTIITLDGQTFYYHGWGDGNYEDSTEERIPCYYSNRSRIMCNYYDATPRRFYIKFMKWLVSNYWTDQWDSTATSYMDGIFWDNAQPELYQEPSVVYGGHVRESPDHTRIDSLGSVQEDEYYLLMMKPFMQELMAVLDTSANWMPDGSTILNMLNAAGNIDRRLVTDGVADYLYQEFRPRTGYNQISYYNSIKTQDSLGALTGTNVIWDMQSLTADYGGAVYYKSDVMHSALAFFYTLCSDSALLYQHNTGLLYNDGWDTLTWIKSMDQDIGDPIGVLDTMQAGNDNNDQSYYVWSREYDSALVISRAKTHSWSTMDSTSFVSVNLGGTYHELYKDGTRGPEITSVNLGNGHGKILMKTASEAAAPRRRTFNGTTITRGTM